MIWVLLYRSANPRYVDREFRLPVVLLADSIPVIGILMIPKTCAYVWTVAIGYHAMRKEENK